MTEHPKGSQPISPAKGTFEYRLASVTQAAHGIHLEISNQAAVLNAPDFDRVNQRTYQKQGVIRHYGAAAGWLDAGERKAIEYVTESVRGRDILDIGVGGGRTAPLLTPISTNYHGIDYSPGMVATARRRFPRISFREMDARKLDFPDCAFDLVVFSYNGIDTVDAAGRKDILGQVHRVLRPKGYFIFSTAVRPGPAHEHAPRPNIAGQRRRSLQAVFLMLPRFIRAQIRRLQFLIAIRAHAQPAAGGLRTQAIGLVTLFTSVAEQCRQLETSGFVVDVILDPSGQSISPGAAISGSQSEGPRWCYFVSRKAAL